MESHCTITIFMKAAFQIACNVCGIWGLLGFVHEALRGLPGVCKHFSRSLQVLGNDAARE